MSDYDDPTLAAGCLGLVALAVGCTAASLALGMFVGAWAGWALFAACCVAFAAWTLCAAAKRNGDDGDE